MNTWLYFQNSSDMRNYTHTHTKSCFVFERVPVMSLVRDKDRNTETKESYNLGNRKCAIEEHEWRIFCIARCGWLALCVRTWIIAQSSDGKVVGNIFSTGNTQTCISLAEGWGQYYLFTSWDRKWGLLDGTIGMENQIIRDHRFALFQRNESKTVSLMRWLLFSG